MVDDYSVQRAVIPIRFDYSANQNSIALVARVIRDSLTRKGIEAQVLSLPEGKNMVTVSGIPPDRLDAVLDILHNEVRSDTGRGAKMNDSKREDVIYYRQPPPVPSEALVALQNGFSRLEEAVRNFASQVEAQRAAPALGQHISGIGASLPPGFTFDVNIHGLSLSASVAGPPTLEETATEAVPEVPAAAAATAPSRRSERLQEFRAYIRQIAAVPGGVKSGLLRREAISRHISATSVGRILADMRKKNELDWTGLKGSATTYLSTGSHNGSSDQPAPHAFSPRAEELNLRFQAFVNYVGKNPNLHSRQIREGLAENLGYEVTENMFEAFLGHFAKPDVIIRSSTYPPTYSVSRGNLKLYRATQARQIIERILGKEPEKLERLLEKASKMTDVPLDARVMDYALTVLRRENKVEKTGRGMYKLR